MVIIAVSMIHYQLQQRALHLELYSYKKYDFRYRKATQNPSNRGGGQYDPLPDEGAPNEEESHRGDDDV
jgi:hypothetical protein